MKLSYFKDEKHGNFGDDLNPWMWSRLLPGFFDGKDDTIFLGIGSIISTKQADGSEFRPDQTRIIFGSGYVQSYNAKPDVSKDKWDVLFVRGPRTAQMLNLSPDLAVGDSAILLRNLVDYKGLRTHEQIGFVPHWQSLDRGHWEKVCELAGIKMIDPRKTVEEVTAEILKCKFVIAEAMHGAIVADALRVPWIAVMPIVPAHRDKWYDWAEALDIKLSPYTMNATSLKEFRASTPRKMIYRAPLKLMNIPPISTIVDAILIRMAAKRLKKLAQEKTNLSSDAAIENATKKMEEKLVELQTRYGRRAA